MGLDIGIMSVQILERPRELAYRFAWELAHEASVYGTMSGDGNSLGFFNKPEVRRLLGEFAEQHAFTGDQTSEVWDWVESLPWDGDDIELHFNW
jgi:hypothetical protein